MTCRFDHILTLDSRKTHTWLPPHIRFHTVVTKWKIDVSYSVKVPLILQEVYGHMLPQVIVEQIVPEEDCRWPEDAS